MPSRFPPSRSAHSLVLVSAVIGLACGGGSTSTPAPSAIGTAGGTVSEPSGASVVVPPGALIADTTIRIAKDSTGAPALPTGLTAAGSTYVITPHGGDFTQPVEVRIPAPGVTLLPTQELKLAKAQPGGEWLVLGDSLLVDGVLTAQVTSFSFFVPVTVTYLVPLAQALPLQLSTSLTCGGQSCSDAIGMFTATFTATSNSGQLPTHCTNGYLRIADGPRQSSHNTHNRAKDLQAIPMAGGSLSRTVGPAGFYVYEFSVELVCGAGVALESTKEVLWHHVPMNPRFELVHAPAQLEVVEGLPANFEVVFSGPTKTVPVMLTSPTPEDHVIVEWYRSDDGGGSWHFVGRSTQDEANPRPLGDGFDWRYWSVRHGFIASASDQGALVRLKACYTPPGGEPPPPCITTAATRLNVLQQGALPRIADAPRSVLVTAGQTATFTASAGGAPAPTLQWQTRAANDTGAWADVGSGSGATTGSYTTAALALADNGRQYRVVASNALGSAESPPVTASVSDVDVAPTITTQPASLAVTSGSDAAFAVAARGTEALSYQWRLNGTAITGASGPVLRLAAVTDASAGGYSVVVSNAAGSAASDTAVLTVSTGGPGAVAPTIVTQPVSVLVNAGNTATFAVGVSGSPPLAYQWRRDGADIPGATAAFHSIASAAVGDGGTYAVVVSNGVGSDTSFNVLLTVLATPLLTAPAITTQPAAQVLPPGGSATFAVAASGTGPLTYQWMLDGVPIDGATEAVLLLDGVGPLDAGSYTVTVANLMGGVTSSPAQLILVGAPAITGQPSDATAVEGTTATFTVVATGAALRYQWQRNGLSIAGATAPNYTTPVLTVGDHGATFTVLVYNGSGLISSQAARLTVNGITPPGMALFVGHFVLGGGGGSADAVGLDARLDSPEGLLADPAGNLYVAESNAAKVAKVAPDGTVTTLFQHTHSITALALGPDGSLYLGAPCGMPRLLPPLVAGAVNQPVQVGFCVAGQVRGVVVDQGGGVLVSLPGTNAISHVVASGGAATFPVFVGAPDQYFSPGTSDGNGTAARFNAQQGMVRAADGTIFVADTANHTIRKVTPAGDVTTWIGAPGIPGTVDGSGAAARLYRPTELAFDTSGNLFVLTQGDPAAPVAQVRRITPGGDVTTLFNATDEVLALATAAEAPWARIIRGMSVLGTNRVALTAGNAIVLRTLR